MALRQTFGSRLVKTQKQSQDIESGFECLLEWEELPDRRDSRITIYLNDADPGHRDDWRRQHEWLAKSLNDLHRVFLDRGRSLNADGWDELDENDPDTI